MNTEEHHADLLRYQRKPEERVADDITLIDFIREKAVSEKRILQVINEELDRLEKLCKRRPISFEIETFSFRTIEQEEEEIKPNRCIIGYSI